ncbi:MAG: hypothetical protein NUW37_11875 [Planctomycetes bacterium]|nr:hypothetical protein [Planctomycetota bacterium]
MLRSDSIAIVDTTLLNAFYYMDNLRLLAQIFSTVLVPMEVEKEFCINAEKRHRFLINAYANFLWLQKCTADQKTVFDLLKEGLNGGESETISQQRSLSTLMDESSLTIILDDRFARKCAERMGLRFKGTLRIIAILHFQGYLDYWKSVKTLQTNKQHFGKKIASEVFESEKEKFLRGLSD